jgi:D-serine deaminase-like pyridoxal phosphate-dependent protein
MYIERPTAILNPAIAKRNIARMAAKAKQSGVRFRPHFKTHQAAGVGAWFRDEGVEAITVSSVDMAAYFADHGWQDITIAFPVNWRQIDTINRLAGKIKLGLLVESPETVQFLQQKLTSPVQIWLKLDVGYKRTGIGWDDTELLDTVSTSLKLADKLTLQGLLTHNGHTYGIIGSRSIRTIYKETVERMRQVSQRLQEQGFERVEISIGDTPTCSMLDDFSAVDEIRPGNFVFNDMQQVSIGSCRPEDVAVAVACPVVAKHPKRNVITTYGGSVHLSRDYDDAYLYGAVALPTEHSWGTLVPQMRVEKISQEHGIVQTPPEMMAKIHVGDVLMVLPVHSCLTVDLLKRYITTEGETIEMMRV